MLKENSNSVRSQWQMSCASPSVVDASVVGAKRESLKGFLKGRDEPVFISNLVEDWPLVNAAKASNDELRDYLLSFVDQETTVDALHLPFEDNGRMFYNEELSGFNFTRSRIRFSEALSKLKRYEAKSQPDTLYVGSTTIDSCLPGLLTENDIGLSELKPLGTLWLGNKSRIAAHYDASDNLICVAAGKRRVILFPPNQVENLYIGPLHFTPAGQSISMVDFADPDLTAYPKFEEAMRHALVIDLSPGDALYIPAMWWHHIEAKEDLNLLVNFWWREGEQFLGRAENALYHALLTLKQLPKPQRKAWKALFDFYVFSGDDHRFQHIEGSKKGPLGDIDENTHRQFKAWLVNNLKQ